MEAIHCHIWTKTGSEMFIWFLVALNTTPVCHFWTYHYIQYLCILKYTYNFARRS